MKYEDEFITVFFPNLPDHIIIEILNYLPQEYITNVFLHVPNEYLRRVIVDEYYSREIHLILSPTTFSHTCKFPNSISRLIDFDNFSDIDEFFGMLPLINPKRIVLITGGDFRSFESILRKHQDSIKGTTQIDIVIEKYELSISEMEFICSFPNLRKLQLARVSMLKCFKALSYCFTSLERLEELVFLGHHISDWGTVSFPKNLNSVDISWFDHLNINTLKYPNSVTNVYLNRGGIMSSNLKGAVFPSNLTTLMLTYNNLYDLDISDLPRGLITLDLSCNSIQNIFQSSGSESWPKQIESILLTNNRITDRTLESIASISWPHKLKNLRLDGNKISSLQNLNNLPSGLHHLDLSSNPIQSLEVRKTTEDDDYPFFIFPSYLQTLNMSNCWYLSFNISETSKRLKFPSSLTSLNLDECNIYGLQGIEFPESLQRLSLSGNHLKDLNSYNSRDISSLNKFSISWKSMENLLELEFYHNSIVTLEDWYPPPNIRLLDLRMNSIKSIKSSSPLFCVDSSEMYKHLKTIILSDNSINTLGPDIVVPFSLKTLILDRNPLGGDLNIPSGIIHTGSLLELSLVSCGLSGLNFVPSENFASSNLQKLDLNGNKFFKNTASIKDSVSKFYDILEAGIGRKVLKRKLRVNSLHEFLI